MHGPDAFDDGRIGVLRMTTKTSAEPIIERVEYPDWLIEYAEGAADKEGYDYVLYVWARGFLAGAITQADSERLAIVEMTESLPPDPAGDGFS